MAIGTRPDFDIKCFFTPNYTSGFGSPDHSAQGWKRPYELAFLDIRNGMSPPDTIPLPYQYVPGSVCAPTGDLGEPHSDDTGLRLDVEYIELTKHIITGSTAKIMMNIRHDRDVFEIVNNPLVPPETRYGHKMPRFSYPYRAWSINLKGKDDTAFLDANKFVGMLNDIPIITYSDLLDGTGDGLWRFEFNFESFDAGMLTKNLWNSLYYHRLMADSNLYHQAFRSSDDLTFNQAIAMIVAWANASAPSTDFPVIFTWVNKNYEPFNLPIGTGSSPEGAGTQLTGNMTFTQGWAEVDGEFTVFNKEINAGDNYIAPTTGGPRYKIDSFEGPTKLWLEKPFAAITYYGTANIYPAHEIVNTKGRSTWDILSDLFNVMSTVTGWGLKFIPNLTVDTDAKTAEIGYQLGGYDKFAVPTEDFRDL